MREYAVGDDQLREIEDTVRELADAPADETWRLRFTNHWPDDDERPALLAAAFMGPLRGRDYEIDAADAEAAEGLLRFGVATALARRRDATTTFTGAAAWLTPDSLRTVWTPGTRGATRALFAETDADQPDAFGRFHATLVNPHLSNGADGHPDVVFLVRRWLTRRLREKGVETKRIRDVVNALALSIDELVTNVQEHAPGPAHPVPDCLMRVSLTMDNHVRCSIVDTGVGIDVSLEARLGGTEQQAERLRDALEGTLQGWDQGRGIGLPRVARAVRAHGGRLTVATHCLRARVAADRTEVSADGFSVEGTVADCMLPVG